MRGISQSQLASALGVDRRTVQRWEANQVAPSASARAAIDRELEPTDIELARVAIQAWKSGR